MPAAWAAAVLRPGDGLQIRGLSHSMSRDLPRLLGQRLREEPASEARILDSQAGQPAGTLCCGASGPSRGPSGGRGHLAGGSPGPTPSHSHTQNRCECLSI